MIIQYLNEGGLLAVKSQEIIDFTSSITAYTSVTVVSHITTSQTIHTKSSSIAEISNIAKDFYIANDIIYIKPSFYSLTKFIDGIYHISITLFKVDSAAAPIKIEACAFVDITLKCKVAAYLKELLDEAESTKIEKIGTIVHLLHYGLINASNCKCSCDEMDEVFNHLINLLFGISTKILDDCGC